MKHPLVRVAKRFLAMAKILRPFKKDQLQVKNPPFAHVQLETNMYEVNYGLKNKFRRVIILERAPLTQKAQKRIAPQSSPFGKYGVKVMWYWAWRVLGTPEWGAWLYFGPHIMTS